MVTQFLQHLTILGTELIVESRNCRGLANTHKRVDLLNKIRLGKSDVICLQDIHLAKWQGPQLRQEWEGEVVVAPRSSNSRGVAILLNKNLEYTIYSQYCDPEGNFIILDISLTNSLRCTLVNLYGPNKDSPIFYDFIKDKLIFTGNPEILICGDWNVVRDFKKDTYNYLRCNNPKAQKSVSSIIVQFDLQDIWRSLNPDKLSFTWWTTKPLKKARLDYFLTSPALSALTSKCSIGSRYRSDHAPIFLKLNIDPHVRGKGYWKLNASLLKNEELIKKVKEEIMLIKATYALTTYHPDYIASCPMATTEFMIDDSLLWETLLAQLRGTIIRFSAGESRKLKSLEKTLTADLDRLETEYNSDTSDESLANQIERKHEQLVNIRADKISGSIVRARASRIEFGEKPSKYFLQLENSNYINKTIKELELEDGSSIRKQEEILSEVRSFYNKLYSEKKRSEPLLTSMQNLDISDLAKVPPELKNSLVGELTLEELTASLNQSKNNKSPGLDGFPVEFYKAFWNLLGPLLLRALNFSFANNSLSNSQKQGLITCIPKGTKARKFLKNWRPISLLNSSYKLASTCIANRIKPLLQIIVKGTQKGFIQGRNISECTREIYDLMFEAEVCETPGLLLLIDFEKAFDSVAWDFIHFTLKSFDFPDEILKWVSLFQDGATSQVCQNGWLSNSFALGRGCRQGDPLSPYIFILCAEILSQAILNNRNIVGFRCQDVENKLTQFADDTSLFLDGTKKSLRATIKTLDYFDQASGLKMNVSKTKASWIGSKRFSEDTICHELGLDWVHSFTALGISYNTRELRDITELNCNTKLSEIDNLLTKWDRRNITLIGRILIVKSLALSKLVHFLIALPSPKKTFVRELNKKFYHFIWNHKPPKIKSSTLELDIKEGGLKMVNL